MRGFVNLCPYPFGSFFGVLFILMVSRSCIASGYYIVSGIGVVGFEHKQKLELRLFLGLILDLNLMNILFAGSFG